MTSTKVPTCTDTDADLLLDLGIGCVTRTDPRHAATGWPRGSADIRLAVTSPAPSVVDLLSDSDIAPSPDAHDTIAGRRLADTSPTHGLPALGQQDSAPAAAAARSPSVKRLLEDMVDLLSASDDDQDAALAAALAAEGDCAVAMAGSPRLSPPRRKSSSRRIRKPARFKDADAVLASPAAGRQSAEREGTAAEGGPTIWPSPPEDSFIEDAPTDSAPVSPCDMPDVSLSPKRCGPCAPTQRRHWHLATVMAALHAQSDT